MPTRFASPSSPKRRAPMPTPPAPPSGWRSRRASSSCSTDRSILRRSSVEIGQTTRLDTARIATLRNQRQAEIPAIAAERDSALFRLATLDRPRARRTPLAAGARTSSLKLDQADPGRRRRSAARAEARRPGRRTPARRGDGTDRSGDSRALSAGHARRIGRGRAQAASAICSATRSASCSAR